MRASRTSQEGVRYTRQDSRYHLGFAPGRTRHLRTSLANVSTRSEVRLRKFSLSKQVEPVELDGWGKFWVAYIVITVVTIAVVSSPFPFGLNGLIDITKRKASGQLRALVTSRGPIPGGMTVQSGVEISNSAVTAPSLKHNVKMKALEIAHC